jgi:hypothetical protein
MNIFLSFGMCIVTVALAFYSTFFILKRKRKDLSLRLCTLLGAGAFFDISGTIFMIIGSRRIPFTFHGLLGYSALGGMIAETVLIWRNYRRNGGRVISNSLNRYTIIAYSWWVLAYIAGGIIAMVDLR